MNSARARASREGEKFMSILSVRSNRRRGAAAVELAVALLPLMTILMGVIEGGCLMSSQEVVVNAAREGARLASLGGSAMGSNSTVRAHEVNYRVRQYLSAGGLSTTSATITISDLDDTGLTDLSLATPGDRIKVYVSL